MAFKLSTELRKTKGMGGKPGSHIDGASAA